MLAKERLNAPGAGGRPTGGRDEAYVMRLTPTGEVTESPDSRPDDYAAVRPVPSPATTTGRTPFMIGGKRRRADR